MGCALEFVGFLRARSVHCRVPWGFWVYSMSLGCALSVVGFIRGRWVYYGALRVSSGSSAAARFIGVRPGGLGFIRARWIHWGAPFGLSGSPGVTAFIRVRPAGRRVLPGSLHSLECALGVVGYIQVAGSMGVHLGCRRVHPV